MSDHIELRSLVDTHDRPFVVIGKDYTVVAVNAAYERTFNADEGTLVGQKCHRVLHHQERPCHEVGEECPFVHCYLNQEPCSCLHTHHDPEGGTRWVRINMYPLKCADGNTYVGEMIHEIAARGGADTPNGLPRPVGASPAFLHVMEQLEQAARTDAPVLLIGETGTGKELAAHFIHCYSSRKANPYVALDCTVIPESLFESEVFGHERGAFTGSIQSKKGLFEIAEEGTLFLDEIGEASLTTQSKLLRVLETGEFRRVGGNDTIKANARIICATNRHLWKSVESGTFREDLYYRIACFCIRIPALRERLDDIPLLAKSLLERMGGKEGRLYRISEDAIELLLGYHYPGNIRELRNILQVAVAHLGREQRETITRAVIAQGLQMRASFAEGLASEALSPAVARIAPPAPRLNVGPLPGSVTTGVSPAPPPPSLHQQEADYIHRLLRDCGGDRHRVATLLGISERTLYRKLARSRDGSA
jgi:transcriptional regulator with PAS, ATPase and Fis domain